MQTANPARIFRLWRRMIVVILLSVFLVACGSNKPPISLAPTQEIIQRAIALQVQQTQQKLSEQLAATTPDLKISHINVQVIDPLLLGQLPTYHLQGRYDLNVALPNQAVTQEANEFDLYLQRQQEGKTWRWLKPEQTEAETATQRWRSYRVR